MTQEELVGNDVDMNLMELRRMYESYVHALAAYFQISLPSWIAEDTWLDNWQGSYWGQPGKSVKLKVKTAIEHF